MADDIIEPADERARRKAEYKRKWARQHADKEVERVKRWRAENREKVKAQAQRYYERHQTEKIVKHQRWRAENRHDPLYKQKAIERTKIWIDENPEQKRAQARRGSHKRRAKLYNAGGSYTQAEIGALIEAQSWLCAEPTCCADLRVAKELDHIIAVSIGGPNHIRNLQWLCVPCNRSKTDKHPIVWAKERGRELTPKEIAIMSEVELSDAEQAVKDAEAHLAEMKQKANHKEFPKWIEPHTSHIHQQGDHISVPLFPDHYVDRGGKVTVLVHDAEHEAKALAEKVIEAMKGAE